MKNIFFILIALFFVVSDRTLAGGDHDHGESTFAGSQILKTLVLPQEVINNLKIETVVAQFAPIQQSITVLAEVKLLPESQLIITPRFLGRISQVYVRLGEQVKKGQPLVTIEPITVGSQPITLTALIEGAIIQQNSTVGQAVSAGDVLIKVADFKKILAKGLMYESPDLGKIQVGQHVLLGVTSYPNQFFKGVIQRLSPAIDEQTRTFSIYALVENTDEKLMPNMQGDLTIEVGDELMLLTVPERAVLGTLGNHFIYVAEGMTFERRSVELGIRRGAKREIISGLFPDELVVTQGHYQLQYIRSEAAPAPAHNDHGHQH